MDTDEDSSDSCNYKFITQELSKYKKSVLIKFYENKSYIGYIKGTFINNKNITSYLSISDIYKVFKTSDKEEEEELEDFYFSVLSHKRNSRYSFYITEFFLDKEFRGNGLGSKILNMIPNIIRSNIIEYVEEVYLMPGPLEKVNGEVKYIKDHNNPKLKKLIQFYKSMGFKKVDKTEYMVEEI